MGVDELADQCIIDFKKWWDENPELDQLVAFEKMRQLIVQALKDSNKKLSRVEAWARFSYELPHPVWSGYHVRAMREMDKALDAIQLKKEMTEDEIDARSRELKEKYKNA